MLGFRHNKKLVDRKFLYKIGWCAIIYSSLLVPNLDSTLLSKAKKANFTPGLVTFIEGGGALIRGALKRGEHLLDIVHSRRDVN